MESLPFRRFEHVPPREDTPVLIESHCPFCAFIAVSKDERIVAMAEAAHDCARLREFRELERKK
jgi:hypothetical protein